MYLSCAFCYFFKAVIRKRIKFAVNCVVDFFIVFFFRSWGQWQELIAKELCSVMRDLLKSITFALPSIMQGCRSRLFGWSRSRLFGPAPAPTPTLQYCKYFMFTGP